MRTLERISVTGYKSIKELQNFELGDLNVLIGANGAGKSNFLSIFRLLNQVANRRLQLFVGKSDGSDTLLFLGRKYTKEIKVSVQLVRSVLDLFDYEFTLIPTAGNHLVFFSERYSHRHIQEENPNWIDLGDGSEETNLSQIPPQSSILDTLKTGEIYHFQDTTESARIKQNPDIYDNRELKSDAANLASFLYLLKNHYQPFYDRILNTVKLAAPFIEDFVLNPMPENAQRIRLRWQHKNSEDDFDISQLSDGTLRFICLTTLLLQPNPPSLIIIDEPELGLHPAAMGLLVEMLRSVATKSQIIISTQSVSMVNQFLPEEVIVVDREKDESVFKRLSSKELEYWLEDYSLGEIWEMNLVGGRPR